MTVTTGDFYFFDLPIYRVSYDAYNAKADRMVNAQIASVGRFGPPGYEISESRKHWISQHHYERYGPWRFNEIIGYIRLHFLGTQVRGEYFSAEKKRNPISRTKVFTYRTHKLAAEINLPRHPTNAEIFAAIRNYVEDCRKELRKDRTIDDSLLLALGPHIDWRGFLSWPGDAQ